MMDVRNIKGDLLASVPITSDAVIHEELMTSDYIALTWNSDSGDSLPVGTFVEYDGERYSLLEPYTPTMTNENEYRYSPQFHSRIAVWDKQPACVYTYENDGVTVKSREFDWSFVGSPADAMQIVKQAIKNETGETWTVMVSDSLPASIEISGQASSIKSVLASIADLCQTEYWVDKKNNVLHLSKCEHGSAVALKVGVNVGVPSVMTRGAEYYTRYYALGSTRNIAQSASTVNGSVNKRLTLDADVYPNGYKDIKGHFENGVFVSDLEQGEVYSKVVVFEDIYPSSNLEIESVRPRMKYRLDGDGKKIKVGGTDDDPIYDQYAIWYFKIKNFSFSEDLQIKGLPLSVHFKSGRLTGQEFELIYHENAKKENTEGDVVPFEVEAGSYEIKFKESSGTIIPDIAYIVPQDGDKITLFNIEMPSEYTKDAQNRLLEALEKEIAKDHADGNTYEVESNPVAFYESSLTVSLGQKVTFTSGGKTLATRVLMVERRLDGEYRQKIRVGSDIIKGSTKELRENVANLNQNVDVLAAFNDLSKSIQDAYGRNQAIVNEAIALINSVWRLEGDNLVTDKQVVVKNNLMAEKEISAGGAPTEEGESSGLGFDDLQWYLDQNKYVKEEDIAQLIPDNIATKDDVDERISEIIGGAPEALDTLKEIADALAQNQDEIGAIFDVISKKASKEELKAVDDKHSASIAAIQEKDNSQDQAIAELKAKDASIESSITEIKGKDEEQDRELESIEDRLAKAEEITSLFGEDEDGNVYVKNSKNFYTLGEISAGGVGQEGESSDGLDFEDLQWYLDQNGYVTEDEIENLIPDNIATKDDVDSKIDLALESYATLNDVDRKISDLVDGAPTALDTLKEIADALENNEDSIGAILTTLDSLGKQDAAHTSAIQELQKNGLQQRDDIQALQGRADEHDEAIEALDGRVTNNATEIENMAILREWYRTVGAFIGKDEHGIYTDENFRTSKEISAGGAAEEDEEGGTTTGEYKMYHHTQGTAAKEWRVEHGLGKYPNVRIVDSNRELCYGDVKYINEGMLTITFGAAFAGDAYCD